MVVYKMENLKFKHKPDRAMIGAKNIIVDECFFDPAFFDDIAGYEKVIYAPPDVAIPGFKTVCPPRVFYGFRMKMPKGINITVLDDAVQPIALYS
jgi:hypothetical protein